MKRYFKSWAQSLIFVLIITLALPFGMMGFAETTETSITKTAELIDGEVKLGSYTATLNEDKSSVTLNLEMEDDFTLTSVEVRLETTTSDAIVFESSVVPIETTFEFEINDFEEFDIVVEVEATREEVVESGYEAFSTSDFEEVKGNISFKFSGQYEVDVFRQAIKGNHSAYFVNNVEFSKYLDNKDADKKGKDKDYMDARMELLPVEEIQYLVNQGYSDEQIQELIWYYMGSNNDADSDFISEINNKASEFAFVPGDKIAFILAPFKSDEDGSTEGDTINNEFDEFVCVMELDEDVFKPFEILGDVNYSADEKVSFNLENENQNPGTGTVVDDDNGSEDDEDEVEDESGNNNSGGLDDSTAPDDDEEESEDDSKDDTNVSDESEDDEEEDEDSGEGEVEEPDNDTDVESPSDNNSNNDKETDQKDRPKQNDEVTESVVVVVEAPTPMGSSASVETPVNVPVETEELEDLEEVTEPETPRGNPALDKLPKTGEIPPYAYYAAGTLLLGLGVGLRKKF